MFVNYVREINAFHRFANDNYLGSGERLLWFGLMDCINQSFANGSDWPGEYVSIPNKKVLSHVPFSEDTLTEARNRLKQRGLIDYIPGKKNKEAPKYKVYYFAATSCTEIPGNMQGNTTGNMQGNTTGNMQGNTTGSIPDINLNVNRNPYPNAYIPDEEAEAEERMRACAREAADAAFRQHFGRSAMVAEANRLAVVCTNLGMTTEVLQAAIQDAALHGAKNPAPYVIRLLSEWSYECIRTMDDLNDFRLMRDMYNGCEAFPANTVTREQMTEAREKRRIANERA